MSTNTGTVNLRPEQGRVLAVIDQSEKDLVDLCLLLGGTRSPASQERQVAEVAVDWMKKSNIESRVQPITQTSANAIGKVDGMGGGGKSLTFDAHLDTGSGEPVGRGEYAERMEKGFVEGDKIFGHGIVNDKAQVAAFMIAARSIKRANVKLKADLLIAGVAFETGGTSVDEFQGIDRPGEGFGSRWLIDRGIVSDYALVGETTNFGIVSLECGYVQLKISVEGRGLYTPRIVRPDNWQASPNAFEKAAHVIQALEKWCIEYERREKKTVAGVGEVNPKAQVLAVRGDGPSGMGASTCHIYLDVWILPGFDPKNVVNEVKQLLVSLGAPCQLSLYHWSRGYVAKNAEPLIEAVKDAHHRILGTFPGNPPSSTLSMWRDINAFNEVGIPSICYGPPRQKETYTFEQNRAMRISDLVTASKIYALTAMSICGTAPEV